MATRGEFWIAGVSALLAVPALVLSGVFLALFFGGAGDFYGSLNDFFTALVMALLVPPALALPKVVGVAGGRWFRVVTWLSIAGLALATVGQLLLIVRVISLGMSFVTGSLGILPVVAWGGAQTYLGIRHGTPSRSVGWTIGAALAFSVLLTLAWSIGLDVGIWLLSIALLAALIGYLTLLGRRLLRYA